MANHENRVNFLRRTAKDVRDHRVKMRICSVALGMLGLLAFVLYIVATLYKQSGSFTVSLDKYEMTKYGLTLSETSDMAYNSSHLDTGITESITNIASEEIPENVDSIDGAHSGQNYIAYTFYLQNAGEVPVAYEYSVVMSNVTNGIDEAIRLRLYVDGTPTTYAKTKTDGTGPEPFTKEFYSANVMAFGRVDNFKVGDKTKFTVVIWIEGSDPECLDWLIGGQMKIDMKMSIVH